MALIKCKECGKEYSNLADKCPSCGVLTKINEEQPKLVECIECSLRYPEEKDACPNCGCPTKYSTINKPKNRELINIPHYDFSNFFQKIQRVSWVQVTDFIDKHVLKLLSVFTIILVIIWGVTSFNVSHDSNEQVILENKQVEDNPQSIETPNTIDTSNLVFPIASKPSQRLGILDSNSDSLKEKFGYSPASKDSSDLRVVSLTTNSISIQLNASLKVVLMDALGKKVKESSNPSKEITFDGLKANTEYVLMSLNTKNEYLDYLVFETMNSKEDIDLHYFINFNDSNSEEVTIDIFGYFNGVSTYTLNNERYHTNQDELDIQHDSLKVITNGSYSIKWTPETNISFSFKDAQGYFQVSYTSKKSAEQSNDGRGRIEGRKTSDYLISTGEQLLVLPVRSTTRYTEDVSLSMNAPINWGYNIGFVEPIDGFYKVEKDKEWIPLAPIQAYNLNDYKETALTYPDLLFEFIYPITADSVEVNQLYDAWDMLYQLWGRSPEKGLRYTLFVADDTIPIYGGEYSTGQSYTTAYELLNEMGVHQFFHVWQGWKYHINVDEMYDQWWGEGFNRYFSHKVLEAVGDTAEGYQQLGVYYNEYYNSVQQGYVVSLLSRSYPYNAYEYNAGALFTYSMDKQLQAATKGAYSMDIVLKHVLEEWITNRTPFRYADMIDFIKDESGIDFTQFFEDYVANAEMPLVLDEFGPSTTSNSGSMNNSFGVGVYGNQAPVELFASKFQSVFSNSVEMASYDALSEAKINNFSNTAILHSLNMGAFPSDFTAFLGLSSSPELNKLNIYHNEKGGTIYVIIANTEDELLKFIENLSSLE